MKGASRPTIQDEQDERRKCVNEFFRQRPGWSRFNYEAPYLRGWDDRIKGRNDPGSTTMANTTDRRCYEAGNLAAANFLHELTKPETR